MNDFFELFFYEFSLNLKCSGTRYQFLGEAHVLNLLIV